MILCYYWTRSNKYPGNEYTQEDKKTGWEKTMQVFAYRNELLPHAHILLRRSNRTTSSYYETKSGVKDAQLTITWLVVVPLAPSTDMTSSILKPTSSSCSKTPSTSRRYTLNTNLPDGCSIRFNSSRVETPTLKCMTKMAKM